LTTNYVVVQYQRDLADPRSAELQAIIDYNLSLASLDKALGTTLKNKNIRFSVFYGPPVKKQSQNLFGKRYTGVFSDVMIL